MKASNEQIALWQEQYGKGNIRELHYKGNYCYLTDPTINLNKMKVLIAAQFKSTGHLVDAMFANCWIDGDDIFKTDEAIKQGIEKKVSDLMDLPDHEIEELENGNDLVTVNDFSIEVRKATRMDIRYAEDRDKHKKPLVENIFLLERLAVDEAKLKELRLKPREYVSVLLAIKEVKDEKLSDIKKF